ncbi:MAG: Hsp20/alpha crystallin family protein [Actinomycetota bacterium]|nr:Hsp20/alpha crystallin family protein [Actinomycetota bacterium]
MLMRTDPFRDLERLTAAVLGTAARPAAMPMDAYRAGETFVVQLDLPGVDPESIDLTVEKNVLTIRGERKATLPEDAQRVAAERTHGVFTRQLFLGETLDVDAMTADYDAGVLTITLPVREQAKPRKITVGSANGRKEIDSAAA